MTLNGLRYVILTGVLSGCFCTAGQSSPNVEALAEAKSSSVDLMLTTLVTSDQQKMFGPFPCWKTQVGSYQYKSFTMRYLLNAKTHMRDIHKSWIAALYRDTEVSNRYMLKFMIRDRGSESDTWKTEDNGIMSFVIEDGNTHFVGQVRGANQNSTIHVAICEDAKFLRYLQIKISSQGWYDELRLFME